MACRKLTQVPEVISFSQSLHFSRVSSCLYPLRRRTSSCKFCCFSHFWWFHLSSGGVRVHGARLTGHKPAENPVQINKLSIYRTVASSSEHMLHRLHYRQDVRRGISKKAACSREFYTSYLIPELMHIQVMELYFNSGINSISEFQYFDFHTHVVLK